MIIVRRCRHMRTVVNVPEDQITSSKNYKAAFGIWKNRELDGVCYQQKLRDESE